MWKLLNISIINLKIKNGKRLLASPGQYNSGMICVNRVNLAGIVHPKYLTTTN